MLAAPTISSTPLRHKPASTASVPRGLFDSHSTFSPYSNSISSITTLTPDTISSYPHKRHCNHSSFPTSTNSLTGPTKQHQPLMYSNQPVTFQGTTGFYETAQQHPSHSFAFDHITQPQNWSMYQGHNSSNHLGGGVSGLQNHNQGLFRRNQGHQRTTSGSTVNSTGPSSPYMQSTSFPFIANSERSPTAQTHFDDSNHHEPYQQQFSGVGYTPSKLSHTPAAHFAIQAMSIDHHHNSSTDDIPDFSNSSRQSVSSRGQDSPSTPQIGAADEHEERPQLFKVPTNDYKQTGPRVELFRTESAACADELYNPENFTQPAVAPAPRQAHNSNLLSPHRSLVSERIRTANSIRSQSPAQSVSRERSPFRQGSPLAPALSDGFKSPGAFLATAADSRRQQREEASAKEWASHQPKLHREPTKTMSPKDALLEYNDDNAADMPLFADTIPAGYQKHFGGSEAFTSNFINGTNQDYSNMANPAQNNIANFRASTADANPAVAAAGFNFMPPAAPASVQNSTFSAPQYRAANFHSEPTPDFPAHLTSMESSMSESGAPNSSQGSTTSVLTRPADTSANHGTYACAMQGCTQRFDSPVKLQKHKRDFHQSARDSLSSAPTTAETSAGESASPDGSHSPEPLGSGMTSAALAARNSQTGPHKCGRINPSTGKPCNTIFSRPYDLTRHEDTIHNRIKQKVRCQYCREEKTFSRNDALTRHMRVVHPEVDFTGKRGRKGEVF